MNLCLRDFQVIRPNFEAPQETLLEWLIHAHTRVEMLAQGCRENDPAIASFSEQLRENLFKIGLGENKIQTRGYQLDDWMHQNWDEMKIYNVHYAPEGYHLDHRMNWFDKEATEIFETFYPEDTPLPPHLIHVTCTGYVAPSPAQRIVSNRESSANTMVTHAYHMGCYAQIPSIRMAMGHCFAEKQPTDIVHTEFASLHLNPSSHTMEQMVIQSLFADGFIKYTVDEEKEGLSLSILAVHEEIVGKSLSKMTWTCHNWGFHMSIAKDIPVLIQRNLKRYLHNLANKADIAVEELKGAHFAIHPGGPKIIQQTAKTLELSPEQIKYSQEIMQTCGNMSSATLPHVWEKILKDDAIKSGDLIVSLAFGPGLNITGGLFKKRT